MRSRTIWAAAILVALLAHPGALVAAEPTAAEKETARGLIDRGDGASDRRDFAGALEAYQGAYALVRVPTTGAAVARTLASLGRLVEARKVAREVLAMPLAPDPPPAFAKAREQTAALLARIEPRIAKLKIEVRGQPPGSTVTTNLDGKAVPEADRTAGVDVDPAKHVIEALAGDARGRAEVTIREGDNKAVTIDLVVSSARGAGSVEGAPEGGSRRTLGFVIGGIGAAGVLTAGITGAMLLSRNSKIQDECPDKHCSSEGRDLIQGSSPWMVVNAVAWGMGAVGLGAGAYLLLTSGSRSDSSQTAVGPTMLPGGAGLSLRRGF